MRITLTMDDDLLAAARSLARDRSESIGDAISELIRRGLAAAPQIHTAARTSGFPVFAVPPRAHPITLEDVRQAEDDA